MAKNIFVLLIIAFGIAVVNAQTAPPNQVAVKPQVELEVRKAPFIDRRRR